MNPSILDTDMLMPLFKGVPLVVERARQHRDLYGHLNITIITYVVRDSIAYPHDCG